jgi:hypothetical protein
LLPLRKPHIANLLDRGFREGEYEERGYGTVPTTSTAKIVRELVAKHGADTLLAVPGFYRGKGGDVGFSCLPGMLIPVRDEQGWIIALMSRPDAPRDGNKYLWVSSTSRGGPGSGSPPHVPLGCAETQEWRLTEGPLKADLATVRSGIPTIGVSGVTNWSPCLSILKAVGCSVVWLAFDADAQTNDKVAEAMLACSRTLKAEGFEVNLERWLVADGKGIDDLLTAGKMPEVLIGEVAEEAILEIARAASCKVQEETSGTGADEAFEAAEASLGDTIPEFSANGDGSKKSSGPSASKLLVSLVPDVGLFHDAAHRPYAAVNVGGHVEVLSIRTPAFKRWLGREYYLAQGGAPPAQAMSEALGVIEAKALYDGPLREVFIRVGTDEHRTNIYLDLGDQAWRVVRIGPDGWELLDRSPVPMRRSAGLRALPMPETGGSITALRKFLNLENEDSWKLVVAWLVAALRPTGPYPVLVVLGEQGSAKSFLSRLVRGTVDPHAVPLHSGPRDERDLMIAANASWVVALDNLDSIPPWLSDALCRLATGGGFRTRQLYTDDEETLFTATRPLLLNGIDSVATRPDLLDRAILLKLPAITDEKRREEAELLKEYEAEQGQILGGLLDLVSEAMKLLPSVHPENLPRMADFARLGAAVGIAMGWTKEGETFLDAYYRNIKAVVEVAAESSIVATAVQSFMERRQGKDWDGLPRELLEELGKVVGEQATRARGWPTKPNRLTAELTRVAPVLRKLGIYYSRLPRTKKGNPFLLSCTPPVESGENTSTTSTISTKACFKGSVGGDGVEMPVEIEKGTSTPEPLFPGSGGDGGGSGDVLHTPVGQSGAGEFRGERGTI